MYLHFEELKAIGSHPGVQTILVSQNESLKLAGQELQLSLLVRTVA